MPPRTFRQLQDRTLTSLGYPRNQDDTPDDEQLFLVRSWLNEAYYDIWTRRNWTWLEDTFEIDLTAQINAGTASVTAGSQAVTLSTTLGTDFNRVIGRFFISGGQPYRIESIANGTSFTLQAPFRGATRTTANYQIIRVEYTLPWEVDSITRAEDFGNGKTIVPRNFSGVFFPFDFLTRIRVGNPDFYFFRGHTWDEAFNIGTISGTANPTGVTGTITGSGTTWSADGRVEEGDTILVFGTSGGASGTTEAVNYPYRIRTIGSDTSLTVEPGLKETYEAGTLYEIKPANSPQIIFWPWPVSATHINLNFDRRLHPLVADTDKPRMPEEFHDLIHLGAKYRGNEHQGNTTEYQTGKSEFFERMVSLEWNDSLDQQRQEFPEMRVEYL